MQRTDTARRPRFVTFRLAVAAMAVAVVVAACGDDSSDGNAELQAFIRFGNIPQSRLETRSVELGTEEAETLAQALNASPGDEVHTALTQEPPTGTSGFGFVLSGCDETGARLTITGTAIDAELIGNEHVDCVQPAYFLATFHIPTEEIPEGAVLA